MRKFTVFSLPALALGSMMITTAPAFADGITLSLTNPFQTVGGGQTVTFDATVTVISGNANDVYLNGDNSSITDAGSVFTLNDTDFFNNFPLFLTPTGPDDTFTGAIFTLTNAGPMAENYTGVFNLLGGANGSASGTLATVDFGSPAVTGIPEPSSLLMVATGLVGALLFAAKHRSTRRGN